MTDPKTIPEQLDAARNGAEFGAVLGNLFAAVEKARDEERWPVIQCNPAPDDDELQADRDRKHAAEERHWLDVDDRRIAAARLDGWYAAFAAAQVVLQQMIDEAGAKITEADRESGDVFARTLRTLAFGQKVALLGASESLANLANSRGVDQ